MKGKKNNTTPGEKDQANSETRVAKGKKNNSPPPFDKANESNKKTPKKGKLKTPKSSGNEANGIVQNKENKSHSGQDNKSNNALVEKLVNKNTYKPSDGIHKKKSTLKRKRNERKTVQSTKNKKKTKIDTFTLAPKEKMSSPLSKKKKRAMQVNLNSKKKQWGSKKVLASGFPPPFPSPTPGTEEKVFEILLDLFKKEMEVVRRLKEEKKSRSARDTDEKMIDANSDKPRPKWKPPRMIFGTNEVTRALENDLVEVVVVCKQPVPPILSSHLPTLCFSKNAKLVVLPGNGTKFGALCGTKRLLVFGVLRKPKSKSADTESKVAGKPTGKCPADILIERLKPFAAKLDYKWLKSGDKPADLLKFPEPKMIPHRDRTKMDNTAENMVS